MARSFFDTHKPEPRVDFRLTNIKSLTVVDYKQRQMVSTFPLQHDARSSRARVPCYIPERFLDDPVESQRDRA